MLKKILITIAFTFLSVQLHAQIKGVGIGDGAIEVVPDQTAILELSSTQRGFLMPRMTAAQREAISAITPAVTPHGLMVMQIDNQPGEPAGLWYYYNDGIVFEWRNILNTSPIVTFQDIQTGENTQATMTVGAGASIVTNGGIIQATQFFGTGSITAAVDLGTGEVNGSLGINNGGTGLSAAPAAGSIIYSDGTTFVAATPTVVGQVLQNIAGVPTWITPNWTENAWELSGNAATDPATNYIGTSDAVNLSIRTNATERINIDATGTVNISENTNIEGNVSILNATNKNTFITAPAQVVDLTYNLPLTQGAVSSTLV